MIASPVSVHALSSVQPIKRPEERVELSVTDVVNQSTNEMQRSMALENCGRCCELAVYDVIISIRQTTGPTSPLRHQPSTLRFRALRARAS